jgi:hypothetical protein
MSCNLMEQVARDGLDVEAVPIDRYIPADEERAGA